VLLICACAFFQCIRTLICTQVKAIKCYSRGPSSPRSERCTCMAVNYRVAFLFLIICLCMDKDWSWFRIGSQCLGERSCSNELSASRWVLVWVEEFSRLATQRTGLLFVLPQKPLSRAHVQSNVFIYLRIHEWAVISQESFLSV